MNKHFKQYLKSLLKDEFFKAWQMEMILGKKDILYQESENLSAINLSDYFDSMEVILKYENKKDQLSIEYREGDRLQIKMALKQSDIPKHMLKLLKTSFELTG